MNSIEHRLQTRLEKLGDPYYFEPDKDVLLNILESPTHLNCQKQYVIDYFLYLQQQIEGKFNPGSENLRIIVLIINWLLTTGFKQCGISFSGSSNGSSSDHSWIEEHDMKHQKYTDIFQNNQDLK